jgi:hypothetical protein
MKVALLAVALALISFSDVAAGPGDPVVVRGALAWPSSLSGEPFAVARGDDGRFYYFDLATALRRTSGALNAGERLSAIGVEGRRPHEVVVTAVGRGDDALATAPPEMTGLVPSASPTTDPRLAPGAPPVSPPTPTPPSEQWERVDGTVRRIAGRTLTVRTSDSRDVSVELGPVAAAVTGTLRPGAPITVFGVNEGRRFVARGIVQIEDRTSALPRRR